VPFKRRLIVSTCLAFLATIPQAFAQRVYQDLYTVAFAGSMGVVMDKGLGPAFSEKTGVRYQGIGEASLGFAHLLAAKSLSADVFVPVSQAPIKIVEKAGLVDAGTAEPVASTQMVLAYSPKSKFAAQFAAASGDGWINILEQPGMRFGRTDPNIDPQGQYLLFALQLAEAYYNRPGLAAQITGAQENNAQIFAEPSLLARLQDGEIDATIGYESAIVSQKLPFIKLPPAIDFSSPALKALYAKASLTITAKGITKIVHPSPLVFYAAVLKNSTNVEAAQDFVAFMLSRQGQAIFAKYGYNPGVGPKI